MIGQQVVCVDPISERHCGMKVGATFTVIGVEKSSYGDSELDFFSIEGFTGRHYRMRFKPLEEMQDTNFRCIAGKKVEQ
jgi:hypothetical protein